MTVVATAIFVLLSAFLSPEHPPGSERSFRTWWNLKGETPRRWRHAVRQANAARARESTVPTPLRRVSRDIGPKQHESELSHRQRILPAWGQCGRVGPLGRYNFH